MLVTVTMASPLQTGKQSVDLKPPSARGSRIRRDPPLPAVKEATLADRDEVNQRVVLIGVVAFALAIAVIIIGLSSAVGWSPGQYTIEM